MSMPRYAEDAITAQGQGGQGQGGGMWQNMDWNRLAGSLGGIAGGMFGNSGAPYEAYGNELQKYYNQANQYQSPFYQAGVGAIPQFQQWLQGQRDPSQFINNLMGQYQESPFAKYQQQQGIRAAQNAGSASGLTGSTPLAQFMQENAQNISSQDMQNWLGRVLGINTQYGQGLENMMGRGQSSANALSQLASDFGKYSSEAQMGRAAGQGKDKSNLWGGLLGTAGTLAGAYFGGPVGASIGGSIGNSIGSRF